MAKNAGRHAAKDVSVPFISSSISSANVYSSSAPTKSPHQQKMLAMHRQILACSSGGASRCSQPRTRGPATSNPVGSGSPSCRFLAKSDMARSAKCSFSVYSSVLMSFSVSCSSFHAFMASLFSTASTIATSTPCGRAFLRRIVPLLRLDAVQSDRLPLLVHLLQGHLEHLPALAASAAVQLGGAVGTQRRRRARGGGAQQVPPCSSALQSSRDCVLWVELRGSLARPQRGLVAPGRLVHRAEPQVRLRQLRALSTPLASIIASQICPSASLDSLWELMISPTMRRCAAQSRAGVRLVAPDLQAQTLGDLDGGDDLGFVPRKNAIAERLNFVWGREGERAVGERQSKIRQLAWERPTKTSGPAQQKGRGLDKLSGWGRTSVNLWTATSCLPLLAAAFALWYRRNAETRVPLTSPGKLEKDVSVPASGGG